MTHPYKSQQQAYKALDELLKQSKRNETNILLSRLVYNTIVNFAISETAVKKFITIFCENNNIKIEDGVILFKKEVLK